MVSPPHHSYMFPCVGFKFLLINAFIYVAWKWHSILFQPVQTNKFTQNWQKSLLRHFHLHILAYGDIAFFFSCFTAVCWGGRNWFLHSGKYDTDFFLASDPTVIENWMIKKFLKSEAKKMAVWIKIENFSFTSISKIWDSHMPN